MYPLMPQRGACRSKPGSLAPLSLAAVLLCLTLVSCAPRNGRALAGNESSPSDASEPFDWTRPFLGQGVPIAEAAMTTTPTRFPLKVPNTPGPTQVFRSPFVDSDGKTDAIFFVIQHPDFGIVWIGESAPDVADAADRVASYKEAVAENGQPGRQATAEIVTLPSGDPGLLSTSLDQGSLYWVEGETQFAILGPTLTRSQILDVAESI